MVVNDPNQVANMLRYSLIDVKCTCNLFDINKGGCNLRDENFSL